MTFVIFSFRVFLLLFPNWLTKKIIKCQFKNHYVIFGQDELCMALIRKIHHPKEDKSIQDKKNVKINKIVYIVNYNIVLGKRIARADAGFYPNVRQSIDARQPNGCHYRSTL
jgi:predicted nucleic acid-binding protein